MVEIKRYPLLCEESENKKKKEPNFFDLPERGFEPQNFSNYPAHDLNFHVKIKSKQASKRDGTLYGCCKKREVLPLVSLLRLV